MPRLGTQQFALQILGYFFLRKSTLNPLVQIHEIEYQITSFLGMPRLGFEPRIPKGPPFQGGAIPDYAILARKIVKIN